MGGAGHRRRLTSATSRTQRFELESAANAQAALIRLPLTKANAAWAALSSDRSHSDGASIIVGLSRSVETDCTRRRAGFAKWS